MPSELPFCPEDWTQMTLRGARSGGVGRPRTFTTNIAQELHDSLSPEAELWPWSECTNHAGLMTLDSPWSDIYNWS